jgi:ribosomal protein S12 methylthiotransferase
MLYGIDIKNRKTNLVKLLKEIDKIEGDFWVRVLYSYPNEIFVEFIDWLNTSPHAVKYVDMPIQHTVPEVLEAMNRTAAIEATLTMSGLLREMVPDVTLRTTVITGFPGETELRFKALRSDLKRMQFDRLGAFAFSPEKGTAAYSMRNRPSRAIAEEREKIIMQDAEKLWGVRSKKMLGATVKALVVAPGVARMASQAPDVDGVVYLLDSKKARKAAVGDFVNIKLSRVCGFDFEADVE